MTTEWKYVEGRRALRRLLATPQVTFQVACAFAELDEKTISPKEGT